MSATARPALVKGWDITRPRGRQPGAEPGPSSYAAWMSPSPERQLPRRDRLQLQLRSAARIQQRVPIPDTTDTATATAGPPPPWAHV